MSGPLMTRQRVIFLGLLAAFWVLPPLISAAQLVYDGNWPWGSALRFTLRDVYAWVLLSPFVLWIAQRYPFESGLWKRSVPVHLGTFLAVVLACEHLSRLLNPGPPPPWGPRPPGAERRPREGFEHSEGKAKGTALGLPPGGLPPEGLGPPRGRWGTNLPPFSPPGGPGGPPRRRPPGGPGQFGRPPGALPSWWRPVFMRANFSLPIYCFLVSVSQAFTYFQRSRERERETLELAARLAQAKLQALRAQLHPHFLFNTLNAIATLIHRDPQAADEMIGNLSDLLRSAIEGSDEQEVPLRKELEFLDRYLQIQQVRFGDRLRVVKQIDPQVLTAHLPSLILQPLVENAIRHGIEPRVTEGIISLVASRVGEQLKVSVEDTGPGLKTLGEKPVREGIGLANTRARLQELYGSNYRLGLSTSPTGGFLVQLELPYHESPLPAPRQTSETSSS